MRATSTAIFLRACLFFPEQGLEKNKEIVNLNGLKNQTSRKTTNQRRNSLEEGSHKVGSPKICKKLSQNVLIPPNCTCSSQDSTKPRGKLSRKLKEQTRDFSSCPTHYFRRMVYTLIIPVKLSV